MPQTRDKSPHQQQQQPKTQRRSHRKSRNGCVECKRRHIRCDERRPACANCTIAERTCVFPPAKDKAPSPKSLLSPAPPSPSHSPGMQSPQTQPYPYPHATYQSQSTSTSTTTTTTACSSSDARTPNDSALVQPTSSTSTPLSEPSPLPSFGESFPHMQSYDLSCSDPPLFTAEHLSLLYHVVLSKHDFFMDPSQDKYLLDIAIRLASSHPYLIDEVLALSALHKASTTASPSESPHLLHTATELQTRAITRFTRLASTLPPEDIDSSVPRFLFATTLALHDLADTLSSVKTLCHSQFHVFVNRFVDCFRIHHGVRAVVQPTWQHLLTSELEPLLALGQKVRQNLEPGGGTGELARGDECRPLYNLLDSSDLGPTTVSACREAVDRLQWSFNLYRNLPRPNAGPHAALAFSVTVSTKYIDILRRLQPEAVIILAYYSVLLHYCKHYWVFGDLGVLIVRAIVQHLGVYWQDAMAWPLRMIEKDGEA